MAFPTVKTVEDCADFGRTVLPYIDQFYALPSNLLAIRSASDLQALYVHTHPVISSFSFSLLVAAVALVVSETNRNYSQIDRVWSILPAFYNLHYWSWAYLNGIRSQRLDIIAGFSIIWSARLTWNYWRKGGYQKGSEDYRWQIIKKYTNWPVWLTFNVVFISLIQSVLLAAVATPTYLLTLVTRLDPKPTGFDNLFPQILLGLLALEFVADNQQWAFQNAKKDYQKTAKVRPGFEAKDLERGFLTKGLWAYSRHPNFAAEQGIWVALYQWGCFDTQTLVNWTFAGAFCYLLIFQGSTPLTEWITSKKYPQYKQYQRTVGRFVPSISSLTGKGFVDAEDSQKVQGKGKQGKKHN